MNVLWMIGQSILNGLTMGGIYALVGVGLTIIFGVMKVVNFAQGEYLVIGMYITLVLNQLTGLSPYLLLPPTILIAYLFGRISYGVVVKPLLGQPGQYFVVATMGLSFVIISVLQLVFTTNFWAVETSLKSVSITWKGFSLGLPRIIACGFMIFFVVLVDFFLKRTDFGRAMRATSENTEVAQSLGINTNKMYGFSFAVGTTFAAITGLLLSPIYFVYPTAGTPFKTIAMVIIVMGGPGNIGGAVASGLIAGLVEAFTATFVSNDLAPAAAYLLLIIVLAFKPAGLFGKGARVA
ncbi:branched-chain amino acid ABC transporter permease [Lacrimispora sp. NSJ-141]|uniref:Branched-chain amino acid ABC transporter permease n=1 Tax=Lientehia hominis TaxID=2897778 RepID=A0AAP2RIT6_9FIRM|nr:branched-chain amino acid ABC transporter permease [Lientehia hominis]MCD2492977.1 branched-chain amino acid ABC transporter permease [Lientehia hominis]